MIYWENTTLVFHNTDVNHNTLCTLMANRMIATLECKMVTSFDHHDQNQGQKYLAFQNHKVFVKWVPLLRTNNQPCYLNMCSQWLRYCGYSPCISQTTAEMSVTIIRWVASLTHWPKTGFKQVQCVIIWSLFSKIFPVDRNLKAQPGSRPKIKMSPYEFSYHYKIVSSL